MSSIHSFLPDLTGMDPFSLFTSVDTDRAENDKMSAASTADSAITHAPTVESKISYVVKEALIVKKIRCGVIRQMIPAGGDGRYVARSQRGVVQMGDRKGLVGTAWEPNSEKFEGLVSVIAPYGPDCWTSCTSDGTVDLWKNDGTYQGSLTESIVKGRGTYYKRSTNLNDRINCFAADISVEDNKIYYAGYINRLIMGKASHVIIEASQAMSEAEKIRNEAEEVILKVSQVKSEDSQVMSEARQAMREASQVIKKAKQAIKEAPGAQRLATCRLKKYVSGIYPLSTQKVMAIVNSSLRIFTFGNKTWSDDMLVSEEYFLKRRDELRAILDVCSLKDNFNTCAISAFDGTITVLNLSTKTVLRTYGEHGDHVRNVVNISSSPNVLASCSDDKTSKIWDVRCSESVATIPGHASCIVSPYENLLVSASYPKHHFAEVQLNYWDIRKL